MPRLFSSIPVIRLFLLIGALPSTIISATPEEFFEKKIRPVLAENCYACHSEKLKEPKANLRLDSREGMHTGGDSGPVVVPQDADASLILKAISYTDLHLRMPPTGKLSDETIADFREWIRMGAYDPRESNFTPSARKPLGLDIERGRKFWSFQPLTVSPAPAVQNAAWAKSDIDRYILAKLEAKGLSPAPEADRRAWIRRITFDLTGLPPTPQEVRNFLADNSADAHEKVVDRLLASPHYGERYGRHWLDLVRFAETNGHEYDNNKLDAWRYRDYVVRAFNEDIPFNTFVKEHIAGDLLPQKRISQDGTFLESPLATNFFWFGEVLNSATDSEKTKADTVDNQIDVLSKAFLGLTVACSRCHDHKFDPVPTKDYYGLAGVMHSTSMREAVIDSPSREKEIRKAHEQIAKQNLDSGFRQHPGKKKIVLRSGDQLFEDFNGSGWGDWIATGEAFANGPQFGVANSAGYGTDQLVGSLTSKKFRMPKRYVHVLMTGTKGNPRLAENEPVRVTLVADDYRSVYFLAKGNQDFEWVSNYLVFAYERMGYFEIVDRSRNGYVAVDAIVLSDHKTPPEVITEEPASWPALPVSSIQVPESSFGMIAMDESPRNIKLHIRGSHQNLGEEVPRHLLQVISKDHEMIGGPEASGRTELAEWLSSADNALVARVFVNRIWKHHFGQGIVRTTDNFGLTGEPPTHKELLDYLADRFIRNGWSIKKLHRDMVLSATYRMSSKSSEEAVKQDPRNTMLHHYPVQRLEAESIRDSMLSVSGRLNSAIGGPSIVPYISRYQEGRGKPASGPVDGDGRRSLYVQVRRNFLTPMFLAFDFPLPTSTTGNRSVSTVPSQALMMLNNEFVLEQSALWAKKVKKESSDPEKQVQQMFEEAYSRPPSPDEIKESLAFVNQGRSLEDLAHVLMNSAEFIYVQ